MYGSKCAFDVDSPNSALEINISRFLLLVGLSTNVYVLIALLQFLVLKTPYGR
jgi:hypothetical protein